MSVPLPAVDHCCAEAWPSTSRPPNSRAITQRIARVHLRELGLRFLTNDFMALTPFQTALSLNLGPELVDMGFLDHDPGDKGVVRKRRPGKPERREGVGK